MAVSIWFVLVFLSLVVGKGMFWVSKWREENRGNSDNILIDREINARFAHKESHLPSGHEDNRAFLSSRNFHPRFLAFKTDNREISIFFRRIYFSVQSHPSRMQSFAHSDRLSSLIYSKVRFVHFIVRSIFLIRSCSWILPNGTLDRPSHWKVGTHLFLNTINDTINTDNYIFLFLCFENVFVLMRDCHSYFSLLAMSISSWFLTSGYSWHAAMLISPSVVLPVTIALVFTMPVSLPDIFEEYRNFGTNFVLLQKHEPILNVNKSSMVSLGFIEDIKSLLSV